MERDRLSYMKNEKTMQVRRPAVQRVYLVATDGNGRNKSKSMTIYGTTPEKAIEFIHKAVEQASSSETVSAGS